MTRALMLWIRTLGSAIALALIASPGAAQNGDSPHGELSAAIECSACHTTQGWQTLRDPLEFDHDRQTGFVLTGKHVDASCGSCHVERRFDRPQLRPSDCASCHLDVHQGRLETNCASCHNTRSFTDAASLEQHARGRFPLYGAHVEISCEACHTGDTNGSFTPLDPECWACHASDYAAAESLDHQAASLPHQCGQCHSPMTWRDATFDHAADAGFPLDGRHASTECAACHSGPGGALPAKPAGPADCVVCHQSDYDEEHSASGYPTECATCHTAAGWEREPFDHAGQSNGFELLGQHGQAPCTDCHLGNDGLRFNPADQNDCVACHRADYDTEHAGSGYPLNCGRCHSVNGWSGADFEHAQAAGGFVLVGRHAVLACDACHIPPDHEVRWTATDQNDCIACHRPDYDTRHTGSGYPLTCNVCHDANDWTHAVFDHVSGGNGFALIGAHAAAACGECHGAGNALLFPQPASSDDCIACHRPEFDANHGASNLPTTCRDCHSMDTFTGATFDHSTTTFPLEGAHATTDCTICHGPGGSLIVPRPAGPNDCVACHRPEYDAEHAGSSFPTTCADCHTTSTFTGATFDHSTTAFPLQGAHQAALCTSCHDASGALLFPPPSTSTDCIACHQTDYDREHAATGYPVTCLDCHDQTDFTNTTFDHDAQWFPIYSPKHAGQWNSCADCHPTPATYAVFTCLTCHVHRQTDMDDKHKSEPGYVYDSQACLSCHPRGT